MNTKLDRKKGKRSAAPAVESGAGEAAVRELMANVAAMKRGDDLGAVLSAGMAKIKATCLAETLLTREKSTAGSADSPPSGMS